MQKNSFTIVLKNPESEIDLKYSLNDTDLARAWYKKIKHLCRVPVSKVESDLEDTSNLDRIYQKFCEFAGLEYKPILNFSQQTLNELHEVYEKSHEKLSKLHDNEILYIFHHAIHENEKKSFEDNNINVGWGTKEGMLTSVFNCNKFYEKSLLKNHVYLRWAELGKKPLQYWKNQEPDKQERFLQLAKPHFTFRAKFFIQAEDQESRSLPINFIEWFAKYKDLWLAHYKISKWDETDEFCAPLLGIPEHKEDINYLKNNGYKFDRIIYDSN